MNAYVLAKFHKFAESLVSVYKQVYTTESKYSRLNFICHYYFQNLKTVQEGQRHQQKGKFELNQC